MLSDLNGAALKAAAIVLGMAVGVATILFGVWTMINASEARTLAQIESVEGRMASKIESVEARPEQVFDHLKGDLRKLAVQVGRIEGAVDIHPAESTGD